MLPTIKHWKARNKACIYLGGQRIILGPWNSDEAMDRYHALMADIAAGVQSVPERPGRPEVIVSVGQLAQKHKAWALTYYRKRGQTTTFALSIARVVQLLEEGLFSPTPLSEAGPLWLEEFQQWLAADPAERWSRRTINDYVGMVVGIFRWGVSKQVVSAEHLTALETVKSLRKGRPPAPGVKPPREHVKRQPVERDELRKAREFMPRTVRALVDLHILLGGRPEEICQLRFGDIKKTKHPRVFVAVVKEHKTEHLENAPERKLYLGPKAMRIVRFMKPPDAKPTDHVFSPIRAATERSAKLRELRKTKLYPSHTTEARRARVAWRRERVLLPYYTPDSYRLAVRRACVAAKIEPAWTPYQIRHLAATRTAELADLDVAQALLGHANIETTMTYVKVREKRAAKAAERLA